jgi:GTP cyclohydrolase I
MADAVVVKSARPAKTKARPSRAEAEAAVRTLLAYVGDDPAREGLRETPRRVVEAYDEYFAGYGQDAEAALATTFTDVAGYQDMVLLQNVAVQSHCEHHMAPFIGRAHFAYLPDGRVVGLSKVARVIEVFAKRLQTQEALTQQIVDAFERTIQPRGIALLIEAEHQCMSMRGVRQTGVSTVTTRFTGVFEHDQMLRERFLTLVNASRR